MYCDTKKGLAISHLSYVDDTIIFCKGLKSSLQKVLSFLKHYEKVSGQTISFDKNSIFVGKSGNKERVSVTHWF